jgi:hypothetical protein
MDAGVVTRVRWQNERENPLLEVDRTDGNL